MLTTSLLLSLALFAFEAEAFGRPPAVPTYPFSHAVGTCSVFDNAQVMSYSVKSECDLNDDDDDKDYRGETTTEYSLSFYQEGTGDIMVLLVNTRDGKFQHSLNFGVSSNSSTTVIKDFKVASEQFKFAMCCNDEIIPYVEGGCDAIQVLREVPDQMGGDFNACLMENGLYDSDITIGEEGYSPCPWSYSSYGPPSCVEGCYFGCVNDIIYQDLNNCGTEQGLEFPGVACCLVDTCDLTCDEQTAEFKPYIEEMCSGSGDGSEGRRRTTSLEWGKPASHYSVNLPKLKLP